MAGDWRAWRRLGWSRRRDVDAELWRGHTVEAIDHALVAWRIGRLRTNLLWNRVTFPLMTGGLVLLAVFVDSAFWAALGGPIGATVGSWRRLGPGAAGRLDAAARANIPTAVAATTPPTRYAHDGPPSTA